MAARELAAWPDPGELRLALPSIRWRLDEIRRPFQERIALVQSLARTGDPQSAGILLRSFGQQQFSDLDLLTAYAGAMYQVGENAGVAKLIACLDAEKGGLRCKAFAVLEALSIATAQPLNYSVRYWKRWWYKLQGE
jgi:hypothetical protein